MDGDLVPPGETPDLEADSEPTASIEEGLGTPGVGASGGAAPEVVPPIAPQTEEPAPKVPETQFVTKESNPELYQRLYASWVAGGKGSSVLTTSGGYGVYDGGEKFVRLKNDSDFANYGSLSTARISR